MRGKAWSLGFDWGDCWLGVGVIGGCMIEGVVSHARRSEMLADFMFDIDVSGHTTTTS